MLKLLFEVNIINSKAENGSEQADALIIVHLLVGYSASMFLSSCDITIVVAAVIQND